MTTDADLRDRLHDLADDAPRGGLSAPDVWHRGVRRQRLRRVGAVAGAAAVVALVAGLATVVPTAERPSPVDTRGELGIPREVLAPDPWSEPTRTPGPLAVVATSTRRMPDGLTGTRETMTLYGVSTVDGVSRFLDLPVRSENLGREWLALSPDGSLLASTSLRRVGGGRPAFAGWDVHDLVSGEVRRLRVPGSPSVAVSEAYEISFSGDGRYLLTSFSVDGRSGGRADSLVAWDLETGSRHVVEGPGHYWLPGPATAPSAIAWTRQRSVRTFDPTTGERGQVTSDQDVLQAVWSPDGETLAFIGQDPDRPRGRAPWRLFVQQDGEQRRLDVGDVGHLLGWQDDTHLVISDYGPRDSRVVDVTTGEQEPLPLSADSFLTPLYATALWERPVTEAVGPPSAGDPRFWMHREVQWTAFGLLLGGLLLVPLVLRRRRGAH